MDENHQSELYDKDIDLSEYIGKDPDTEVRADFTLKFQKEGERHIKKYIGLYIKVQWCITSLGPDPSYSRF